MSRQDPSYSSDDGIRDALALLTAVHLFGDDQSVVDAALENALSMTDHTALAFNQALISEVLLRMAADARGVSSDALLQEVAAKYEAAINSQGPEERDE